MERRQTVKNTLLAIAVILLMAFAMAAIPQIAHAQDSGDHTWNVKSLEFIPASPTVEMSKIKERDNDGIDALNLANRYKKGFNNCFFMNGDKCVVTYNDNSTEEFEFNKIKGIGYAEFKATDGEVINLEALHTDNAEELKMSGEVSVDELAAIIGTNGITIEYGVYKEVGDEIVGHCVYTHTSLNVYEDTGHDHVTAIRTRNETPAQCEATGMRRTAQYCQICGKYFEDMEATIELNKADLIIPMLGHDWGKWSKLDTDQEKEVRICSRCNEKDTRIVPPEGHTHDPGTEQHWTKPKCTVRGIDFHYVCMDCGALLIKNDLGEYVEVDESALRIPADRHKRGIPEKGKETASTCSSRGGYNLTYKCEKCGMVLGTERVVFDLDPNAHVWNDGEVTKVATCTEMGNKHFVCTKCGAEKDEVIQAGHKWNSFYTIDKKATYAAVGLKSIHCSVCNARKPKSDVSVPKLIVKAVKLKSVKAGKKGFTARWTKGAGINGYEIQYARNKKFTKGKKTVVIKKPGTVSRKVTKLKAKKKYYVRVRAYKTVSGKKYRSKWSNIKAVTTKR